MISTITTTTTTTKITRPPLHRNKKSAPTVTLPFPHITNPTPHPILSMAPHSSPPQNIIPTKPVTPQKKRFTRSTHCNLNPSHRNVQAKKPQPIKWDSRVIDNEGLGRKKTACCLPMVKDGRIVSYCNHHHPHSHNHPQNHQHSHYHNDTTITHL